MMVQPFVSQCDRQGANSDCRSNVGDGDSIASEAGQSVSWAVAGWHNRSNSVAGDGEDIYATCEC